MASTDHNFVSNFYAEGKPADVPFVPLKDTVVFPRIAVAARRLVCTALQTQQHPDGNDNLG